MATESKIEDFAEELGKLLGAARGRAESWLGQRQAIAEQLTNIRDTAADLLQQLTGNGGVARRGRRGRPPAKRGLGRPRKDAAASAMGATPTIGKRRKRTMSAEARRRISEA